MDISSFRPLNGWMLVRTDDLEEKTESGLLIKPGPYSEHLHLRGTVLKTSEINVRQKKKDGTYRHSSLVNPIKAGARILFPALYTDKYYFIQFREKFGKEYALLKPSDVLLYENPGDEGTHGIDDLDLSATSGKVSSYGYGKDDNDNRDTGAQSEVTEGG